MLQPASSAVDKLAEVDLEFPARDLQLKYVNMIEEMIYPVMEA